MSNVIVTDAETKVPVRQPWTSADLTVLGGLAIVAAASIGLGASGLTRLQPLAGLAVIHVMQPSEVPVWLLVAIAAAAACRLIADHSIFRHLNVQDETPLSRSAELLTGPLVHWERCQALAALIGGILLPLIAIGQPGQTAPLVAVSSALVLAAEFVQRGLFFAAVSPPRMPGVSRA